MPDNPATPPPASPAPTASEPAPSGAMKFDIGEEFGTAKRNLPPAKIVLIGIAIVLVVGAIMVFTQTRPTSAGSIDDVAGVEVPNQGTVLAVINVTLHNGGKKAMWIHSMKATLKTDSGEFPDDAASPVDFERYFQAFPALKQHAIEPLKVETKIQPGGEVKGTIMVVFPVTQDDFDKRNSLSVTVQAYDQRPGVITKYKMKPIKNGPVRFGFVFIMGIGSIVRRLHLCNP